MSIFLDAVRTFVPEFAWSVDIFKATDYLLPRSRVRVFLRGLRKQISYNVPAPLPPFGSRSLWEALGDYPRTPRTDPTKPQRVNLCKIQDLVVNNFKRGKLHRDQAVVVSVDRSEDGAYNRAISIDVASTLTCNNRYLSISSVGDVIDGTPNEKRASFCFPQIPQL